VLAFARRGSSAKNRAEALLRQGVAELAARWNFQPSACVGWKAIRYDEPETNFLYGPNPTKECLHRNGAVILPNCGNFETVEVLASFRALYDEGWCVEEIWPLPILTLPNP
jgi:hypothetical protein